jgi:hypothetical protein
MIGDFRVRRGPEKIGGGDVQFEANRYEGSSLHLHMSIGDQVRPADFSGNLG